MSQPAQQGQSDDEGLKLAVIFLILALIVVAIIAALRNETNAVIGAVSWVHVAPFAYAADAAPWLTRIPFLGEWLFQPAVMVEGFLSKGGFAYLDVTESGLSERNLVLMAAGRAACLIYGPLYAIILFRGSEFRPDHLYRRRHDLESMISVQAEMWPTIRVSRKVDPLKEKDVDIHDIAMETGKNMQSLPASLGRLLPRKAASAPIPAWGRSLAPEEWLVAKGLVFDAEKYAALLKMKDTRAVDFEFHEEWGKLDIESISEAFADQLRESWKGAAKMRPVHRALFAVMALFYGYDVKGGNALLNDIGILAGKAGGKAGTMDAAMKAEAGFMQRIDKVIAGEMGSNLARFGEAHAWVETAFATFLATARHNRGVLASSSFIWLKPEDRQLWYILNNVGSEAIMVEAAGALAHHRAEIQIGKPIIRPAVYQASRSLLEDYLDMTPARVAKRRDREERQRRPGTQIDMMIEHSLSDGIRKISGEGLDDDEDDAPHSEGLK